MKTQCKQCGAEILVNTAQRTGGLCMPGKQGRRMARKLTAEEASAELDAAAMSLQSRAEILRVPTRRIPPEEWAVLRPDVKSHVPVWFQEMLSHYSLFGVALEYRDQRQPYVRVFSFSGPEDLNQIIWNEHESLYRTLIPAGYLPIGYEQDGDLWVLKQPFEETSPVFLLDHGSWDGGSPSRSNGLIFAASRLSLLICSMGISELSYQDSNTGVTSLIWRPDC